MDKVTEALLASEALLARLETWKRAGRRSVNLEMDLDKDFWQIWIYDFALMAGTHLNERNVHENWDDLIVREKREALLAELDALEEKMGG